MRTAELNEMWFKDLWAMIPNEVEGSGRGLF
jgi:hypothetical protein